MSCEHRDGGQRVSAWALVRAAEDPEAPLEHLPLGRAGDVPQWLRALPAGAVVGLYRDRPAVLLAPDGEHVFAATRDR